MKIGVPACVGLRYGYMANIAAFLGTCFPRFPTFYPVRITASAYAGGIFLPGTSSACTRLSIPRPCYSTCVPAFLNYHIVQEFPPAVHRLRFSPSP